MKYLFEPYFWALTDKAQLALDDMEASGIDRDLALALLEKMWPEAEVYRIE